MQLMVLIVVFRENPCQVYKGLHAPELIRRPTHICLSALCLDKIRNYVIYVTFMFHLPLLTVVNVADAARFTHLNQLIH